MTTELVSVSKTYEDMQAVVDCTLSLPTGQIVALLGPNGAGKTTLLKLMCGLLKPDHGKVSLDGKSAREARHTVAYSSDGEDFYPWMTARDIEKMMAGLFAGFDVARFRELVIALEVPNKSFSRLSKGEKRRQKLAAVLARNASLVLLDEPLSGIDIVAREKIVTSIARSWKNDCTLILSTHEFEGAESLFHRVLMMKAGRIVQDMSAEQIKASGQTIAENFRQVFQ